MSPQAEAGFPNLTDEEWRDFLALLEMDELEAECARGSL